jgi:nitroreductase
MELYEAIRLRHSVRSFEAKPVPREVLDRILEAARQAPSANNLLPWRFIVVTEEETRSAIAASGTYSKFIAQSPVVIVGCGDTASSGKWCAVDTAIALEHIALAAVVEGLGSCWIGSYDEATVKRLLSVPEDHRVVALLALGYPKERIDPTKIVSHLIHPNKKIDRVVSDGTFSIPWRSTAQSS